MNLLNWPQVSISKDRGDIIKSWNCLTDIFWAKFRIVVSKLRPRNVWDGLLLLMHTITQFWINKGLFEFTSYLLHLRFCILVKLWLKTQLKVKTRMEMKRNCQAWSRSVINLLKMELKMKMDRAYKLNLSLTEREVPILFLLDEKLEGYEWIT